MNPYKDFDIPEDDKCCTHCNYLVRDCENERADCINYTKEGTVNHFVPDDWYLQDRFGCKACKHHDADEMCDQTDCSRRYNDLWERRVP